MALALALLAEGGMGRMVMMAEGLLDRGSVIILLNSVIIITIIIILDSNGSNASNNNNLQ